NAEKIAILDAPPGASCPVINTVVHTHFILLVTEPTPFGLHDLRIAVQAFLPLGIPMGVVLNRSDVGDRKVQEYCRDMGIPLLMEIPHDRKIAEGYARGELLIESAPAYSELLLELFSKIRSLTGSEDLSIREATL
ncbi:(4Fe-4S)-binding protein, partial [Thermodesulfobacteriota bacterium]